MGLLDSLKSAAKAITGNAAKVTIEYPQGAVFPGDSITVKVTATSTGAEVKSKGAFIDVTGTEHTAQDKQTGGGGTADVTQVTFEQAFQIAPAFVLGAGETKTFEGSFQVPVNAQPSYDGRRARHGWTVRGRIEATGNDPDSGEKPLRVGLRN